MMQWTVRLEARSDQGEVKTTELVTFDRPVVDGTLADLGLRLSEAKALLAELQASMVQSQVAEYAACHRVLPAVLGAAPPQGPAHAPAADPVRHGRGRGAPVPGLPLPPARASGGDVLADLRAADRPLHTGVGASAGRARGTHLVPRGRPDT